jgi:Ca2+-binding EF-hand superfamily protein
LAIKATPFSIEQGLRLGKRPAGTASYMAPETIRSCEYSAKSDVWSAGVTLYALLSGTAPFDQDNRLRQRQQILSGSYIPLNTPAWAHVSNEAKDLIAKMLTVNPSDRISLEDILSHPWIQRVNSMPESKFHEGYIDEIRSLSARSNFKKIVNATVLTIRLRRNALTSVLRTPRGTNVKKSKTEQSTDSSTTNMETDTEDEGKPSSSSDALPGLTKEQIRDLKERFAIAATESAERMKTERAANDRELAVDYVAFEGIMYAVGLEHLATPHVFEIFDTDGNNMVDYKEFISTLATFRSSDADSMRLYFDMFDVDGSGEISFDELKHVMAALLHEEHDDSLHSEHDRSSPAPDSHNQSSESMAESLLTNENASVFQFVPVEGGVKPVPTTDAGQAGSTAVPMLPVSRLSSASSGLSAASFASTSSRGSFARMVSLPKGEANPFQSVFRFTPKMEEGRTIEDLFREMDVNKDGKISFEEFKGWMERDIDKLKTVVQDALR